jgi:hypothetical protein
MDKTKPKTGQKVHNGMQDTKPFCRLSIPTARLRINLN